MYPRPQRSFFISISRGCLVLAAFLSWVAVASADDKVCRLSIDLNHTEYSINRAEREASIRLGAAAIIRFLGTLSFLQRKLISLGDFEVVRRSLDQQLEPVAAEFDRPSRRWISMDSEGNVSVRIFPERAPASSYPGIGIYLSVKLTGNAAQERTQIVEQESELAEGGDVIVRSVTDPICLENAPSRYQLGQSAPGVPAISDLL